MLKVIDVSPKANRGMPTARAALIRLYIEVLKALAVLRRSRHDDKLSRQQQAGNGAYSP